MHARVFLSVLLTLACPSFAGTAWAQTHFIRGDSTGDGTWNFSDSVYTMNWLFGVGPPPIPVSDAADTNDTGVVTVADVSYSVIARFAGGPLPPPPFPSAGPDPTPPAFPSASSGVVTFALDGPRACPGARAEVTLSMTNTQPVDAMSFRIVLDPFLATFVGLDSAPVEAILGQEPQIMLVREPSPGVVELGTVFNLVNPLLLAVPAGTNQPLFTLNLSVSSLAPLQSLVPVRFLDSSVSSPPVYNLASINGLPHRPVLVDGGVLMDCVLVDFLRGDANEDGVVGISDAALLVSWLFETGITGGCEKVADANADSEFNLADIVSILGVLFFGSPFLPEPYPGCGVESTPTTPLCSSYHGVCP